MNERMTVTVTLRLKYVRQMATNQYGKTYHLFIAEELPKADMIDENSLTPYWRYENVNYLKVADKYFNTSDIDYEFVTSVRLSKTKFNDKIVSYISKISK